MLEMKRKYKIFILIFISITVLSLFWYLKPYTPMEEVEYIFKNTDVDIDEENWLTFKPLGKETNTGFIFYPGARVQPRAYAPLAHYIAESGYKVDSFYAIKLAVFVVNRAESVMNRYEEITYWVIGGHSLGGAMAARYAYNNSKKLSGLILLASYPE